MGEKKVFADTKIVDAGGWETEESLRSGADMVSVLAGASFFTLQEAKKFARKEERSWWWIPLIFSSPVLKK